MISLPARSSARLAPIGSKRLVLFPIEGSDARELWCAVQESRKYLEPWLPWVPFQVDESSMHRFAEACAMDWDSGRAIRFVIRERETRTLVGVVGLENCTPMHACCDLGYWLREPAQGRGYMTEAAGILIQEAFDKYHMHRIRVAAATTNYRSLSVIGRLGFRFEGIARQAEYCAGRWLDHAQFGMLVTDHAARRP